jgi:hypothetical protein
MYVTNVTLVLDGKTQPEINQPMMSAGRQYGPKAHVYVNGPGGEAAIQSDNPDALNQLAAALMDAAQRLEAALEERTTLTDIDGAPLPMAGAA